MEKLNNCPVCKSEKLSHYINVKDHSISGEEFELQECASCSLIFTNPRPDESEIGKYYQSSDYISHSDTRTGLINGLYHKVRSITLKSKVQLLNSLIPQKGKIFDIGCGTGYFLKACLNNGWEIAGSEPDENARKLAEKITGVKLFSKPEDLPVQSSFNIISMWHVLEHVHKLNQTMSRVKELLDNKGYLIIALPNPESFDAKKYKKNWAAFDVPRHLYHFRKESVNALLEKHDFIVKDIKPMKFDSFYVSMLSEKYKTGKTSIGTLTNAFFTGLRSNSKANKTGNYSSLIYIAERRN